jgi:membrane dipeptidase
MWSRWFGYDLHARHEAPLWRAALGGHIDVPRMRDGGMGAQFFSLVSLPTGKKTRGLARTVDEEIDVLAEAIERRPHDLRLVRTASEVEACRRDGPIATLLGIEGAHALEGDLDRIDAFARRGVRYLGLLHFTPNEAGWPAYGPGRRDDHGLTPWGLELVRRCEAAGVLVDLAHINRKGFLDACAIATRPPIVSHTGVLGAFEHWRNIDDAQLRAVADKGGVVGVIFCPRYLGGGGIEHVVLHLRHILNVLGEDTPALGSDWDGFIIPTPELSDPRGLPLLTDALLRAGFSAKTIGKILRGNVMRVLAEA